MKINGNLVFNTDSTGEIQNAYVERLATAPAFNGLQKGRLYFNTSTALFYYNDGAAWVPFATGGNAAALQAEVDALEASIGAAVNGNGTFNAGGFTGATNISNPLSITDAILQLDAALNANNTLAELDDVSFGALANKDILYLDLANSVWRNGQPGTVTGVQGYDAGLASFASLTGPGFVTVNASGNVVSARTFVAPPAGLTLSNTDGSGNVTFGLANDLAAVEGLTSTGIAVRSAADTWVTRAVVGGTSGTVVVTDGAGIAGNPTLNLETLTIPTSAGNFLKFSYDTYGRITATNAVTAADLTAMLDATYVNVAGDSMSGNLNMGGNTITGIATPTAGSDATNKNYVDSAVTGLSWKQAVKVATTTNVNLTTGGLLSVDGVTVVAGDRVLVKNQTNAAENGVYVVAAGTWTRAADADTGGELHGLTVFVAQGVAGADTGWTQTADNITVGSSAVTFVQFTGAGTYSAGVGLALTGNTFSVNLGAGIVELPSDEVGLDLFSTSASAIILTTDGATRSTSSAGKLALLLDAGSLAQGAGGLKVAAGGITEVEINSTSLAANGGVTGGSGSKLAVNVDNATLGITANVVAVRDSGITTVKIADDAVTNNKIEFPYFLLGDGTTVPQPALLGTPLSVIGIDGIKSTYAGGGTFNVGIDGDLSDLSDVLVTAAQDGETLVYDTGRFVNKKIFHVYTAGASATSHTVSHNLDQKYCNVTVVDNDDEVVIPQSITFNSNNTLTVTFTSAILCKVVVMGVSV